MRRRSFAIGFLSATLLAGCATTKTPTATNLADSSPLVISMKPARGALRDAQMTVTDPKTGETFSGRIPGTKAQVGLVLGGGRTTTFSGMSGGEIFSGTAHTSAPLWTPLPTPDESLAMLRGDKGGTLVCKLQLRAGTGLCVTPAGGYVYLDF